MWRWSPRRVPSASSRSGALRPVRGGRREVVALPGAGDPLDEVRRAVGRGREVGDHPAQGTGVRVGAHHRDLGAGPVEHPGADRMPFGGVGVEESDGCPAADDQGELPAQVHRVTDTEVEALAAERRVDVGRVAREQHTARPIGVRLTAVVGEPGHRAQGVHGDVDAGHPAHAGLQLLGGDRGLTVGGRPVELDGDHPSGHRAVGVHPGGGGVPAVLQSLGAGQVGERLVAGDLRCGARELDAGELAHEAAPAVAADQPARANGLRRGAVRSGEMDGHAVLVGVETGQLDLPAHFDAEFVGAPAGRAAAPAGPAGRTDRPHRADRPPRRPGPRCRGDRPAG